MNSEKSVRELFQKGTGTREKNGRNKDASKG